MTPNSMWIGVGVVLVVIALVVLSRGTRNTGNYVRGRVGGSVSQTQNLSAQGAQKSAPEKTWTAVVGWLIAIIGVAVSAYGVFGKK
jgi:preprotein translocase subunit SecG